MMILNEVIKIRTIIAILKDRNDLYTNMCVKVTGNNFDDMFKKLDETNINKKLEKYFSDKDYDFEIVSYEDLDTIYEID